MSLEIFAIGTSGLALAAIVVMVMTRCGETSQEDVRSAKVKDGKV